MSISWLKYLRDFHSEKVLKQALKMLRLHAVPFNTLLENIFNVLEPYQAKFTFPIVASVASKKAWLLRSIMRRGHEVAIHGFKHVKYSYITEMQQDNDIRKAVNAFKALEIPFFGFSILRIYNRLKEKRIYVNPKKSEIIKVIGYMQENPHIFASR